MTQEIAQAPRSETVTRVGAEQAVRSVDLARAARLGALGGVSAVFISAIGMVEAFADRILIQPYLSLGYTALFLIPFIFGYLAAKRPPAIEGVKLAPVGPRNVLAGLIAGTIASFGPILLILLAPVLDLREIFLAISPRLLKILTFDRELTQGIGLLLISNLGIGTVAGFIPLIPRRFRRPLLNASMWTLLVALLQILVQAFLLGLGLQRLNSFIYSPLGGLTAVSALVVFLVLSIPYLIAEFTDLRVRERLEALPEGQRRNMRLGSILVALVFVAVVPQIVGVFASEVLDLVGIFLLMGLGLNIVVGFAGLLDLGYVAFFAVGAYVTAILTSPSSPSITPELTFWAALPFVIIAAAMAGLVVGTPVLRMRGDYLAIVTLGFGEIARLLFISEALFPYVGGAQGIIRIPKVAVGEFTAASPTEFFYPVAAFLVLAIYITWALENSRIGRAWKAMREDEPVAEVMGIDTVQAKLSAFIMGAIIASFGGALFASKIGSVFPHSFQILVSIQVLVLIIVGGMGSIPGVMVGALVIIGLPELLREFAEFKFLLYGALLIYMMLNRPEGLLPSRERARELHQEEMLQDAWLIQERAAAESQPKIEETSA